MPTPRVPRRAKGAGVPEKIRREWNATYAQTPYADLPWFSAQPYPWVVETATSGTWKPGTTILDLGCGAGTNSLYLARQKFHVTGVDLAEGAVRAATERAARSGSAAKFQQGDVTRLPFPDGTFGGAIDIGCFHTLPIHLRREYAREVARVLRPRRVLALSWVAREFRGERGPPHRPSVEEVAAALEEEFLFLRSEYWQSYHRRPERDAPPIYVAWLGRRSFKRPAPR